MTETGIKSREFALIDPEPNSLILKRRFLENIFHSIFIYEKLQISFFSGLKQV